jgi:hypothetical protein
MLFHCLSQTNQPSNQPDVVCVQASERLFSRVIPGFSRSLDESFGSASAVGSTGQHNTTDYYRKTKHANSFIDKLHRAGIK